ncbi:hypothetical protein FRB90_005653 [Tulasnella sp. 427]|nr:hypothetical protein FRB90_005653 [Tulasnella sp. 427]
MMLAIMETSSANDDRSLNSKSPVLYPGYNFSDADIVLSVAGKPLLPLLPVSAVAKRREKAVKFRAGDIGTSSRKEERNVSSKTSGHSLQDQAEGEDQREQYQTTLFKVHGPLLADNSDVFSDLLSLPQPLENQNKVDGLPVINLYDDPIDVLDFINHSYCGVVLPFHPFKQSSFNRLSSLVRFSGKYMSDRLREVAISHIRLDWPSTLLAWDMIQAQLVPQTHQDLQEESKWLLLQDNREDLQEDPIDPYTVIRFAREEDVPEILPAAFYHISRLSFPHDAIQHIPVSKEYRKGSANNAQTNFESPHPSPAMTAQDWDTLLIGKGEIRTWFATFRRDGWLSMYTKECDDKDQVSCALASPGGWPRYWDEVVGKGTGHELAKDSLDVLAILANLRFLFCNDEKICLRCKLRAKTTIGYARVEFWESLPDFFRLKRPNPWNGVLAQGEPVDFPA